MDALQYLKEKYETGGNAHCYQYPDIPISTSLEKVCNYMQEYSDQQNAELRERVKELEAQNKRLKIAHYTIVRAYEEYGPLASVSTKQVSENVLKEIGFDPSKETL